LKYPCENYESQLGLLFPIYGKIRNVPNHHPVYPLVMTNIAIETCHLYWIYPLKLVIFHSCVSLPEVIKIGGWWLLYKCKYCHISKDMGRSSG